MTAKEKAEELVEKFEYNGEMIDDVRMNEEDAKQCALICVDWHLKEFIDTYGDDLIDNIAYWEEVKQEINKL